MRRPAPLRYESRQFIPLAIDGSRRTPRQTFYPSKGIRARKPSPARGRGVRFPADSDYPIRKDGLIPDRKARKSTPVLGLPLSWTEPHRCALDPDAMTPGEQFEVFSDEELRFVAALAAGALSNALLIEQLEARTCCRGRQACLNR